MNKTIEQLAQELIAASAALDESNNKIISDLDKTINQLVDLTDACKDVVDYTDTIVHMTKDNPIRFMNELS